MFAKRAISLLFILAAAPAFADGRTQFDAGRLKAYLGAPFSLPRRGRRSAPKPARIVQPCTYRRLIVEFTSGEHIYRYPASPRTRTLPK